METYRLRPGTPAILPFDGGEATLLVFQTPYGKGWVDLDHAEVAALVRWFEEQGRLTEPVVELRRDEEFGTLRFRRGGGHAWYQVKP